MRGRQREREKYPWERNIYRLPPALGIEPATWAHPLTWNPTPGTLWCRGGHTTRWATPASAPWEALSRPKTPSQDPSMGAMKLDKTKAWGVGDNAHNNSVHTLTSLAKPSASRGTCLLTFISLVLGEWITPVICLHRLVEKSHPSLWVKPPHKPF